MKEFKDFFEGDNPDSRSDMYAFLLFGIVAPLAFVLYVGFIGWLFS